MDIDIEIRDDRPQLALDRRSYDDVGRLTATNCVITSASVCPYLGREIPDAAALGLDPERVYRLYRDPAALKAALPLFDAQPLMIDHVTVTAAEPHQPMIIGTVSESSWDERRQAVVSTVTIWDASAIAAAVSGTRRDISCGYSYKPVMRAGTAPNGDAYDGIMSAPLRPNHIALVETGRVAGAMVSDAAPRRLAMDSGDIDIDCRQSMRDVVRGYSRLPSW